MHGASLLWRWRRCLLLLIFTATEELLEEAFLFGCAGCRVVSGALPSGEVLGAGRTMRRREAACWRWDRTV
jgi:hypothetical protein